MAAPAHASPPAPPVPARAYDVVRPLGDGAFGSVFLARMSASSPAGHSLVAIKKLKRPYASWSECLALRELRALLALPRHAAVVALFDAFLPPSQRLHLVFEALEGTLLQLLKSRRGRPFALGLVRAIFRQTLDGISHLHTHQYFHRDLKPENLLLSTTGLRDYPHGQGTETDVDVVVKVADLGLAREISSSPPYTTYVSTRWYRAPEMLLHSPHYSLGVDIWALASIMGEVLNLTPLFPGQSEAGQVLMICETLGSPLVNWGLDSAGRPHGGGMWSEAASLAEAIPFSFPPLPPVEFTSLFGRKIPRTLVNLIQDMMQYDPLRRPSAAACLRSPFFAKDGPEAARSTCVESRTVSRRNSHRTATSTVSLPQLHAAASAGAAPSLPAFPYPSTRGVSTPSLPAYMRSAAASSASLPYSLRRDQSRAQTLPDESRSEYRARSLLRKREEGHFLRSPRAGAPYPHSSRASTLASGPAYSSVSLAHGPNSQACMLAPDGASGLSVRDSSSLHSGGSSLVTSPLQMIPGGSMPTSPLSPMIGLNGDLPDPLIASLHSLHLPPAARPK